MNALCAFGLTTLFRFPVTYSNFPDNSLSLSMRQR
jgi:hypothetical protein